MKNAQKLYHEDFDLEPVSLRERITFSNHCLSRNMSPSLNKHAANAASHGRLFIYLEGRHIGFRSKGDLGGYIEDDSC